MKKILASVVIASLLTSCSGTFSSGMPSCDNSKVQQEVIEKLSHDYAYKFVYLFKGIYISKYTKLHDISEYKEPKSNMKYCKAYLGDKKVRIIYEIKRTSDGKIKVIIPSILNQFSD